PHLVAGAGGDRLLRGGGGAGDVRERAQIGLRAHGAPAGRGPAAHPAQRAGLVEQVQVAADRGLGDAQLRAQGGDRDGAAAVDDRRDRLVPFLAEHGVTVAPCTQLRAVSIMPVQFRATHVIMVLCTTRAPTRARRSRRRGAAITQEDIMRRRTFLGTSAALGGLGLLAACAPGSDGGGSDAPAPAAGEVDTDVAALGDLTLTVWDQEVRGAQNDAIEALIGSFEEKYPNVTVKRTKQSFDDLQQQTGLALSGNDVTDVLQVNNARGDMGTFVADGLLTDLTGYAEAYGWEDRFSPSVLSKMHYSDDGVTFGEGSLFGLAQTGEICGIYYSQAKLDELGLEPPSTWEEVFELVEAATEADEQAIMLGNLDQWPALHVFGPLQAHFVDSEQIVTLGMGNAGADWTSEENLAALTQLAEWGADGALGESPNGLAYDDAWPSYTEGNGVLLIGGSWLGPDMEAVMGEDLRFM